MKRLILTLALMLGVATARCQTDGYAVLCDTNGVSLPGFYFPGTNIIGLAASNLPTGVVFTNVYVPGTNNIATNLLAQLNSVSNLFQVDFNGINAVFTNGNNFAIAGSANLFFSNPTNSGFIGGVSNWLTSGINAISVGGSFDQMSGQDTVMLGGHANFVNGYNNANLAGLNDWFQLGSNSVILGGYNNTIGALYGSRGVTYAIGSGNSANYSIVGGVGAWATNDSTVVIADNEGTNAWFFSTITNQMIIRELHGVAINTNSAGTNALEVAGNVDARSMTLGGTDLFTLFSVSATSNSLSILLNTALNNASNLLNYQIVSNAAAANAFSNSLSQYIGGTSNFVVGVSNYTVATSNLVVTVSNQLAGVTTTTSNALQGQINVSQIRAGTISIPANATAATYSFTTPMPDGNYSVVLTAQDIDSAAFVPYVDTLNAGYFIVHIRFATNAYNCNFYWQTKENQP